MQISHRGRLQAVVERLWIHVCGLQEPDAGVDGEELQDADVRVKPHFPAEMLQQRHSPHSHPEHSGSERSWVGCRSHSPPRPPQTHSPKREWGGLGRAQVDKEMLCGCFLWWRIRTVVDPALEHSTHTTRAALGNDCATQKPPSQIRFGRKPFWLVLQQNTFPPGNSLCCFWLKCKA